MTGSSLRLCFAPDHPALAGHFPGQPIIPGVLLLDEALHALEQLDLARAGGPAAGPHWYITSVKFHHIVQAGEALRLEWRPQPDASLHIELHAEAAGHAVGAESLVMSAAVARRRA